MEIEFKRCETSSYSPWHLEIAKNLEVPLWCNSEIGYFVKVGDDIYNIFYMGDYYDMYKYFCDLEKKNDSGELTDDDVLALLSSALDNPHKICKCNSLDEFRKQMINILTRTEL